MSYDLILADVRTIAGERLDVGLVAGLIVRLARPGTLDGVARLNAGGRLLTPALCDPHLHPDKAYLLEDTPAVTTTLAGAVAQVRALKPHTSVEAIYRRTVRLIDDCLLYGTTAVRIHAEVDPLLGLRSVEAAIAARTALAGRVIVQIVAFPQEGIIEEPGTATLLRQALLAGADVVGGIMYKDADPAAHLDIVCGLAREFHRPLDLHADFCLPAGETALPLVAAKVREYRLQGRVLLGHCTSFAKLAPPLRDRIACELADCGVTVAACPRTDLFLDGTVAPLELLHEHGLETCIASNNVQNPFTPVGVPSLPRVAAVYALIRRLADRDSLTRLTASLWEARGGIGIGAGELKPTMGAAANLCLWDCEMPWHIVARELDPWVVVSNGQVLTGTVYRSDRAYEACDTNPPTPAMPRNAPP